MFAGGGVELFDIILTMHGLGAFSEEWRNCVNVSLGRHKLMVLRLDRVLVSKRAANRAKDRLVIPVLEDSLAASQLAARRGRRKSLSARKRKSSP